MNPKRFLISKFFWAPVMLVTAAMQIPASGPEKVSGEVVRQPRPLDLSGEWEGTLWDSESKVKGTWTVKLSDHWFVMERGIESHRLLWQMTSEGGDKLRVRLSRNVYVAIYRQESDRVLIALGDSKKDRPSSFRPKDDQSLLILRRAKPGSFRFLGIDPGTRAP